MSNGEIHSLATKAVLDLETTSTNPESCSFTFQLHDYNLGVLLRKDEDDAGDHDFDYLSIWDWRTGKLRMVRNLRFPYFLLLMFLDSPRQHSNVPMMILPLSTVPWLC